jgi:hypothetical protein
MFEKIFALLLRFYPAQFRQRYGAESMQLLRDRIRDERGVRLRLRLWLDLLVDFAAGLPQAHRNRYAIAGASPLPQTAGIPAFRMLENEPLRPGSVMMGSALALAALAAFVFVMNHASGYHPFSRQHAAATHSPGQTSSTVQQVADKLDEQFQQAAAIENCGFDKLELHPGNIG